MDTRKMIVIDARFATIALLPNARLVLQGAKLVCESKRKSTAIMSGNIGGLVVDVDILSDGLLLG